MAGATLSGVPHASRPLVAPLEAFGREDLAVAGGKGANLGELLRAGFAVPPGFVVTTRAYDLAAEQAGVAHLIQELDRALAADGHVDAGNAGNAGIGDAAQALRDALEHVPVPSVVAEAVRAALRDLGPDPVAVRSSATAEDLPDAAFAGQQETFLNVT